MALGTAEFDPFASPLAGTLTSVVVSRYDATSGGLFPLPNVVCESVSARVGPEPWSARFRYAFDQRFDPDLFPRTFEQVFALSLPGVWSGSPYVVRHEDRLVVRAARPDGAWECLFDGFARLPQVDYGRGELVTFEAIGAPERSWDTPIPGALVRDASDTQAGEATWTNLPTRFNPDGRPNCTPIGFDHVVEYPTGTPVAECPVFVDDLYLDRWDPDELAGTVEGQAIGRKWTLAAAARYLIANGNPGQEFLLNPYLPALDLILSYVRPAVAGEAIDWSDPTSYEVGPIVAQDLDVTGMTWPEALDALLSPHGFTTAFDLATTAAGLPRWHLIVRRNDDNTFWKVLGLQPHGATFDPALNAVIAATLLRDGPAANEVVVDMAPPRFESSFILAPLGWEPDVADAADDDETEAKWKKGTPTFDPIKYRVFGVDECGEGHWDFDAGETSTTPADLSALFPDVEGARTYVRRRRPGSNELVSVDDLGRPRKAELWIGAYTDYGGTIPGVVDPIEPTTWQRVTASSWRLLPDQLGIEITADNARAWKITDDKKAEAEVIHSGTLDVVKSMADPSDDNSSGRRVVFRLTTVIEGDRLSTATAPRRSASPSAYTITRRADARDRFRLDVIAASSHLNPGGPGGDDVNRRDDSEDALAHAESLRREHESVRFAGTLTVPRVSTYVRPCDKILGLAGRGLELASYQPGTGEGPRYPMVVGIDWTLSDVQSTRLILADYRGETAGGLVTRAESMGLTPSVAATLAPVAVLGALP